MRSLYSLILLLLLPLVLLGMLFHPGLRAGWRQRLGWFAHARPVDVWVHAASVGEVLAARPLIDQLMRQRPDLKLLVTTNTKTGKEFVSTSFQGKVEHCYLPLDIPVLVRRFLRRWQPRMGIILETELWPNLFHASQKHGVKLVLTNARLSVKNYASYLRWKSLFGGALAKLNLLLAQSPEDAERYRQLGASAEHVLVTGNLKFDLSLPADLGDKAAALRQLWGQRPVFLAASTRDDEEPQVLQAFRQLRASLPDCLLVIVPRHPQRFDLVAQLVRAEGWKLSRRSLHQPVDKSVDVYLGDTLGELLGFYTAAEVIFIGGSLVPLGGQNPLEAAAVGKGVIIGPHDFNFHAVYAALEAAEAVRRVADADELAAVALDLFTHAVQRQRMGEQARQVMQQNQGALQRTLEQILPLLD